jgi:hypothetical protein
MTACTVQLTLAGKGGGDEKVCLDRHGSGFSGWTAGGRLLVQQTGGYNYHYERCHNYNFSHNHGYRKGIRTKDTVCLASRRSLNGGS